VGSNLDVIRRLYAAWNGGDPIDGVIPLLHPDFEWVNPSYAVEAGTHRGHDGWRKANENAAAAFEFYKHEPGPTIETGDKIVCFAIFVARGRAGGVAYEKSEPHVWTLRDEKVVRFEWYHDEDEAFRAAGLTPQELEGLRETARKR
jgi:ketosteroid isomerase-like protein